MTRETQPRQQTKRTIRHVETKESPQQKRYHARRKL